LLGEGTTTLSEITLLVKTNSMEPIPSWAASTFSDSQEINHTLRNPKVHYHVKGSPPIDTILNQMNPTSPFVKSLTPIPCFPIMLLHQNSVCISPLLHMRQTSCPSHPPQFDHINNIWWEVQIKTFLIMQFSLVSCNFIPPKPSYLPQHPT
jgi:hypothetical protein